MNEQPELYSPRDSLLRARTSSSSSTFPSSPWQMLSLWWIYFGTLPPTTWDVINGLDDKLSGSYFARWGESAALTWLSCYRVIIFWETFQHISVFSNTSTNEEHKKLLQMCCNSLSCINNLKWLLDGFVCDFTQQRYFYHLCCKSSVGK